MYLSAEGWLTSGMVTYLSDSDGISLSLSSTLSRNWFMKLLSCSSNDIEVSKKSSRIVSCRFSIGIKGTKWSILLSFLRDDHMIPLNVVVAAFVSNGRMVLFKTDRGTDDEELATSGYIDSSLQFNTDEIAKSSQMPIH